MVGPEYGKLRGIYSVGCSVCKGNICCNMLILVLVIEVRSANLMELFAVFVREAVSR